MTILYNIHIETIHAIILKMPLFHSVRPSTLSFDAELKNDRLTI